MRQKLGSYFCAGAKGIIEELIGLHRGIDASTRFGVVEDCLVRDRATGAPFWKSYIPFVGPAYNERSEGRLLIVGTAQSLAKTARGRNDFQWRLATGLPAKPLFRLYRIGEDTVDRQLLAKEVSFHTIAIQPYEYGILAGIAGVAMAARGMGNFESLDTVTQRIAVTNFFRVWLL